MACVAKAAFTSRIVWLVVLQYALLVDFSRRTAAAPVPARPNPTNDLGPSTDEEDENQDNPPTYSPEQATDDNSDLEIGSNKCRPCKSSFFRYPGGRRRTGAVAGARRHSTGYRQASSAKSRSCRGLCRPCTICAGGLTVLTNCTATQGVQCPNSRKILRQAEAQKKYPQRLFRKEGSVWARKWWNCVSMAQNHLCRFRGTHLGAKQTKMGLKISQKSPRKVRDVI